MIDCTAGERKHLIAEEYLRTHSVGPGVLMILVSRAPAMVWDVRRSADGTVIGNLTRKRTYVNHYSFHIMDTQWGHLTIKMAGHAPFGAQVILNATSTSRWPHRRRASASPRRATVLLVPRILVRK